METTLVMLLLLLANNLNQIIVQKINLALFRITIIWLLQNKSVKQYPDTNHNLVQLLEHSQERTKLTLIRLLEQETRVELLKKMLSNSCLVPRHNLLLVKCQLSKIANNSHLHTLDILFPKLQLSQELENMIRLRKLQVCAEL